MTDRDTLTSLLDSLPEERLRQLIDFARFLAWEEERSDLRRFGRAQLAKAYGENEPDYTEADLKPDRVRVS